MQAEHEDGKRKVCRSLTIPAILSEHGRLCHGMPLPPRILAPWLDEPVGQTNGGDSAQNTL